MTAAPIWQPGTLYLPGDLVQPASTPTTPSTTIANAGFESGDQDWTKTNATIVQEAGSYAGDWHAKFVYAAADPGGVRMTAPVAVSPGHSITARCYIKATGPDQVGGDINIVWLDAALALIGDPAQGNEVNTSSGAGWKQSVVTAVAPTNAAFVYLQGDAFALASDGVVLFDQFSWDYIQQVTSTLLFQAVQDDPGTSGSAEPAWPTTLGQQVIDNEVTWEAVNTSRVVYSASPAMVTGATEPDWPTVPGAFVADGSISWECVSRRIEDENCPNTKVVAIAASKVYAADNDIITYSATANPLDWTTANDAGYLPFGLQQYGANPIAAMGLYRSNLVAFNTEAFQMWQVDADPANSALLDALPIGSSQHKALAPVSNDLFFLSSQGVRTVGIAGGSTNLAAGDVGMPIDSLVAEAMRVALANSTGTLSTYYPGTGQYWLAFSEYPPAALSITGDVPDGMVGDAVSGSYTATGGIKPYASYAVTSGTFPAGLTLASDGSYSGAFNGDSTGSATFDYAWVVTVTDADGMTATIADSCAVQNVTLSGDVPDGVVGEAIAADGYAATNGVGTITFTISAGALPTGLSMDSAGQVTGTPALTGNYSWTVKAADTLGNFAELADTAAVGELAWFLTNSASSTNTWTSSTPLGPWSGPYARSIGATATYGPVATDNNMVFARDAGSTITYTSDFAVGDGITCASASIGIASDRHVRYIDGVLFVSNNSGPYALSLDDGATWTTYTSPTGESLDTLDLARLDSGRWITATYGSPRRGYYTDNAVPDGGWVYAGGVDSGECLVSSGTAVLLWGSGYRRTTNGETWASLPDTASGSRSLGAYGDGVFVMAAGAGIIARSIDDGLTFTEVALPDVGQSSTSSIRFERGVFLVTADHTYQGGHLFVSSDLGLTWAESTLPYDRASSDNDDSRAAVMLVMP